MKHSIKTFFIIFLSLLFILTPILARAQLFEIIAGATMISKIAQFVGGNEDSVNIGSAILLRFLA